MAIWEADRYPIRSNEDRRAAADLEKEALVRAATVTASADDPPEFAPWLEAFQDRSLLEANREAVMMAPL